jgi:hypothetical protein
MRFLIHNLLPVGKENTMPSARPRTNMALLRKTGEYKIKKPRTDDGRRKTEDGRRMTDDRGQKTDDGRQKTEDSRQSKEEKWHF